jgi:hypothetical protein
MVKDVQACLQSRLTQIKELSPSDLASLKAGD